ncbi:hypothetical protein RUM43_010245 [Polyplax serrata]|uniref:Uncharacterized protein n=1 Tax=Polyplax serrata TaxID=468196 RepID=A0AAN8S7Y3_POLSC
MAPCGGEPPETIVKNGFTCFMAVFNGRLRDGSETYLTYPRVPCDLPSLLLSFHSTLYGSETSDKTDRTKHENFTLSERRKDGSDMHQGREYENNKNFNLSIVKIPSRKLEKGGDRSWCATVSVDQWKNAEEHPGFATKELDGGVLFPRGNGPEWKRFLQTRRNRIERETVRHVRRAGQYKKKEHTDTIPTGRWALALAKGNVSHGLLGGTRNLPFVATAPSPFLMEMAGSSRRDGNLCIRRRGLIR